MTRSQTEPKPRAIARAVAPPEVPLPALTGLLALVVALAWPAPAAAAEAGADGAAEARGNAAAARERVGRMPAGVIELDETVISGNQELPKVLYIVPWQQPDGLPDIELRTEFAEVELFRRLYPPAYRRELSYFEASAAATDSTASDSKE